MLKKVLIGLAVALVAFVGFVASRPSSFTIVRTATIAAPADVVFAHVSDFNKWGAWSAWAKLDPTQKDTVGGTPATVGHTDAWVGEKSGEGKMTITALEAPAQLRIKLEFIKPFASTNETIFDLAPAEGGTKVTWTMNGNNGFLGKAFGLFMDMDQMVGGQFEQGLADLGKLAVAEAKSRAEAEGAAKAAAAAQAAQAAETGETPTAAATPE